MRDIEREIERIIAERDFGGWDAESLATVMRARDEWEANNERGARLPKRRRVQR